MIMMIVYKLFINVVIVFIYVSFVQVFYPTVSNKKTTIPSILIAAFCFALHDLLGKYIHPVAKSFTALILFILYSYIVLKLSMPKSIFACMLFSISLAAGDMAASWLMVKQYGYQIEQIRTDLTLSIITDIIIYGTEIGIILALKFIMQTREMAYKYRKEISLRTSIYMLLTFFIIAGNYTLFNMYSNVLPSRIILFYTVSIWIYFIISLYINFTSSELAIKEQQYDQQQDYIKTIDFLINDFRRLKHSHANTIYSIYGYIQEKDWEGLEEYYSEIMDETVRMDNNILLALQKIKVYSVFGLLWNKIGKAESLGIRVEIAVPNEVHSAGMKLSDLCEILGNYLDNAIEAAQESMDKKLTIGFFDENGYLTIRIENSYDGDLDMNRIYEKGYSTKGTERGFGLGITKALLSKYDNVLHNTGAEDSLFKQELVIKK